MKRSLKTILSTLIVLMMSVVTFFTYNLLTSIISNYEAVTKVLLAPFAMFILTTILLMLMVTYYRFEFKKNLSKYGIRKYSIAVSALALVGMCFSIVNGTYVYGSFIKYYVFNAYPLITLILFVLILTCSTYYSVSLTKEIKSENLEKPAKNKHGKLVALSFLFVFAIERLGALVLTPFIFWSEYDSIYVLPYLIQLIVPAAILVFILLKNDFKVSRKVTIWGNAIILVFSVATMVYMLVASKNNFPIFTNPLSGINQLERLIPYPVAFIALYAISLIIPSVQLIKAIIKK